MLPLHTTRRPASLRSPNRRGQALDEKLGAIERYMRQSGVAREVRRRVKRYYAEQWVEQQVGARQGLRGVVAGWSSGWSSRWV